MSLHDSVARTELVPSRPPWSVILGFWVAIWIVLAALRIAYIFWLDPEAYSASRLYGLADYAIQYVLWALLTPAIFWLSGRLPVTRQNWRRRVPLHFGIGLVVVAPIMLIMLLLHNQYAHPSGERHPWTVAEIAELMVDYGYQNSLVFYTGILTAGFAFHYARDFQRQQIATAQMQAQLVQSRMQALRMQLHPHFLYNTLNTVSTLTERDPRAARRVLARLSGLLRRALESTDEQETTLREEMRFTEDYLEIVRARFSDRLRIELSIDPVLEDALVPNLVFQPILENAVEHGIARSLGEGLIRVEAERDHDRLRLRVSDNGPGLRGCKPQEGVGLRNTRARVEALYGRAGELVLREPSGGGTIVEITLPYRPSKAIFAADPPVAK